MSQGSEQKRKIHTSVCVAVPLVGFLSTQYTVFLVCVNVCVYLCRDSALEGFVGGCFIGDVTLWSPVMFCHLKKEGIRYKNTMNIQE